MKFNWIFNKETDQTEKQRCIDMEYKLRPRITRYLIARMEQECHGDFSKFCFDVQKGHFIRKNTARISFKIEIRF